MNKAQEVRWGYNPTHIIPTVANHTDRAAGPSVPPAGYKDKDSSGLEQINASTGPEQLNEGAERRAAAGSRPATYTLSHGGGVGQTRYDYSDKRWLDGRWREEHDIEGPASGTFITVVGLQVDCRWNDGVFTGAYLRQWGTRGGWAACGLQFLADMRWSAAEHKSFGGRYWQEGGSELEIDRLVHVSTAGPQIETEAGTGRGLKAMGGTGLAVFGPWAKYFKAFPKPDKYGRWSGGVITGKADSGVGKRRLATIAVYRPPAHTLTPGCLVTLPVWRWGRSSRQRNRCMTPGMLVLVN